MLFKRTTSILVAGALSLAGPLSVANAAPVAAGVASNRTALGLASPDSTAQCSQVQGEGQGQVRASCAAGTSQLVGGTSSLLILLLAVGAAALGIVAGTSGGSNGSSNGGSPLSP